MLSGFRAALLSVLNTSRGRFGGTGQPVTYAGTAQKSGALKIRRGSVGQSVRNYFGRLQTEIRNRNWRCAVRAQQLMAQPRRRQTGSLTAVEAVEQRLLLSAITVNTTLDVVSDTDNLTSLREAITLTNTNASSEVDTISFDAALTSAGPATIELSGADLAITGAVTITGPGADLLSIDGNNQSRIFTIDDDNIASQIPVEISGVTLTGGDVADFPAEEEFSYSAVSGGAVRSTEALTISNATISGNTSQIGGGIDNSGALTISNSTISGNNSSESGGGVENREEGTLSVRNSTISGNRGSGISNAGTVSVNNSTISGNTGSGISNAGTVSVNNSIIAGNTRRQSGVSTRQIASDTRGEPFNASFNIIGSDETESLVNGVDGNQVGVDWTTVLVNDGEAPTLADNGGPTQTIALLETSPAINAGNNDLLPVDTTFDQRGAPFARIQGGTTDIGAFEVVNFRPVANNVTINAREDGPPVNGTFSFTDSDVPESHTFEIITEPDDGSVTNNGDGSFTFDPGTGFEDLLGAHQTRNVAFQFRVIDDSGAPNAASTLATVTVTVSGASELQNLVVDTNTNIVDADYSAGNLNLREAISITNANPGVSHTITFGNGAEFGGTDFTDQNPDVIEILLPKQIQEFEVGTTDSELPVLTSLADYQSKVIERSFDYPIVLGICGDWCGPCRALRPTTTTLVSQFNDRIDGYVLKQDVNRVPIFDDPTAWNELVNGELPALGLFITFMPTYAIIENGQMVAHMWDDFGGDFAAMIEAHVPNLPPLPSGNIVIRGDVTITGPGAHLLTIDGNHQTRIITIDDGDDDVQSEVSISGVSLTGGTAAGIVSGTRGGAIHTRENLTLTDSVISGSSAELGGGIYTTGNLTIANSTINGNSAEQSGGGIYNIGELTITNSTISANSALEAGAIFDDGVLTVVSSTVSGNNAQSAAGILSDTGASTIHNTLVAGNVLRLGTALVTNVDGDFSESDIEGTISGQSNLIGSGGSGGLSDAVDGNIVLSTPGVWANVVATTLGPAGNAIPLLADNGGSTRTIALRPDSRAVNAGNNALLPLDIYDRDGDGNTTEPVPFDQTGSPFARVIGESVDIGAFEVQAQNTPPVTYPVQMEATEDGGGVIGSFRATDRDVDAIQSFNISSPPAEGSVTNNNDGTFTFDPGTGFQDLAEGEIREVTFLYTATDNSGQSNATSAPATVAVAVVGTNDVPVVESLTFSMTEDETLPASFVVTDPDTNDTHTFAITSQPSEGSVTNNNDGTLNNNDGTFTFDPGAAFQDLADGETRQVSFQYTATDNSGVGNQSSDPATVTVTVTGLTDTLQNLVVDTNTDIVDGDYSPGNLSLREAIQRTNGNPGFSHTITFGDGSADGGTNFLDGSPDVITLNGSHLTITQDVTITGPGADLLSIDGNNQSRIFTIDDDNIASQIPVEISGVTLTGGNARQESGGAVRSTEALTISNATISGNSANVGGGIYNSGALTISNSTISGNTSSYGGGIGNSGTATVTNSTISGNTAQLSGGGIDNYHGALTISNATISGNTAQLSGGGVYTLGTATINSSTISGNSSGIFNSTSYTSYGLPGVITLSNSIVAGNAGEEGPADIEGTAVGGSFNIIGIDQTEGGLTNGFNQVGVDWTTVLVNNGTIPTLADNGGPTQTIALLPTSPAIDAGSTALLPLDASDDDGDGDTTEPLPFDQTGDPFARVIGESVDIGAFEVQEQNTPPVTYPVQMEATEDGSGVIGIFRATDRDVDAIQSFTIISTPAEGSVTNNNDGTFTFDPGTDFQDLAAGETRDVTFQYTATDNSGAANATSEPATVTVTVTGTNDTATVSSDAQTLTETDAILSTSGTLTSTDVDDVDNAFTPTTVVGTIGTFSIDAAGTWAFTANSTFDNLDETQSVNETFNVTTLDGTPSTVQITINGTNDAPTIEATAAAGFREQADAAAQHLQQSGTVSFDDVDATDLISISAASNNDIAWSGGTINPALAAQLVAGFSTGVTNAPAPGTTAWDYDVEGVDLRFLDGGETITFSYTVTATDTQNATADTTVQFVITGTTQVQVSVIDGDLVITGDGGANDITVVAQKKAVQVSAGEFTELVFASNFNGGRKFKSDVLINLGAGNNRVTVENSRLPKKLVINTGAGADEIAVENSKIKKDLRIDSGAGEDKLTLNNITAEEIRVDGGDGNDELTLNNITAEEIRVDGGDGDDELILDEIFSKKFRVDGGSGNDELTFNNVTAEEIRVDGGAGDDQFTLNNVTARKLLLDGDRGSDRLISANNRIRKLRVKNVENR